METAEMTLEQAWQELQAVPSYCERTLVDCTCEACGVEFEASTGYFESGEYAYCAECCHW